MNPEFWAGKTVLITGGAGYLAANLVEALAPTGARLVRLDRPGAIFPPTSRATSDIELDIRTGSEWGGLLRSIHVVFHLAAQTSVYKAGEDPESDVEINVLPVLRMLAAARRIGTCPTLVMAGTATQAGLTLEPGPHDESLLDHPITFYDLHKTMAEGYLRRFAEEGAVNGAAMRLCNVYGPGPVSSSADRGVTNMFIRRALAGEDLTIYGSGEFVRDYVFVEDVASAFIAAAENPDRLEGRPFLVGTGEGHTVAQMVHMIAEEVQKHTGRAVSVRHVDPPAGLSPIEERQFVANPARLRETTGWQARVSLREGIRRTILAFDRPAVIA